MDYLRQLAAVLGGTYMIPPGIISAVVVMLQALGFLPELPALAIIGLTVVPPVLWAFWGLLRDATDVRRELECLRNAWDRSGRNLIPIREAIRLLSTNLSDQWPDVSDERSTRIKAAAKLREIALENQIPIWGTEYLTDADAFQDHQLQISPIFWRKNRIDVSAVFDQSEGGCHIETEGDPAYAFDPEDPSSFGRLKINRAMLDGVCPPPRKRK